MDEVRTDVAQIRRVQTPKELMARVSLSVPASAHMAWKIEAAQQRRDVSGLIVEVMNIYLNTQKNKNT